MVTVTSYVDGSKKRKKVSTRDTSRSNGRVVKGQAYHPDVLAKAIELWGIEGIDWPKSSFTSIVAKAESHKKWGR